MTWTTNFGDVTVDSFEQDSVPNLPENFDESAATPLNYFELFFKPKMFREIVTHAQTIMLSSKEMKLEPRKITLIMLIICGSRHQLMK